MVIFVLSIGLHNFWPHWKGLNAGSAGALKGILESRKVMKHNASLIK